MTDNTFNGFIPPKKNYFHMPNEWIDICAGIKSLAELKVVQYVLRHTWGFQEYDGTPKIITTDEFMHGRWYADGKKRMDKGTGLSNRSVIDGLNNAEDHGYLICDIDDSDKARIVKSYALKMVTAESDVKHLHSDVNNLHTENRCEETSQQVCTSFTSTVKDLHSDCEHSSHRSEKDTKERHFRKTRKEKHESIPAPESDAPTFSPPGVGDARAEPFFDQCFFCQETMHTRCVLCGKRICEKHSRNMKGGDIWCEACVYYFENMQKPSSSPSSETHSQQGETHAQPASPHSFSSSDTDSPMGSGSHQRGNQTQETVQASDGGNTTSTRRDVALAVSKQNTSTSTPAQSLSPSPQSEQAAPGQAPKGKGKKQAEAAPKCDTKEIQRRIDEHRGYALEERVEIIRERGAVKTWCNLHTLEEYGLVMDGLKRDPYWGKDENYYRIGGLTLLKETGRVLALAATQYRPALRIVSTTEPPTVSGRPRLEVPPEYLAMMMGAN